MVRWPSAAALTGSSITNMRALESTSAFRTAVDEVELPDADEDVDEDTEKEKGTVLLSTRYLPDAALAPAAEEVMADGAAAAEESGAAQHEAEARGDGKEEREEQREEQREEPREEKDNNPPTEQELVDKVVKNWLMQYPHTPGFRWTGVREGLLGGAIIAAGLGHTTQAMIALIKKQVAHPVNDPDT